MCGTIREDFDPNNAAMSLWLVFIKYIYAWKIMAIWSHYWLAWILGYIIVWWYTTTLFKSLISKFIQSWKPVLWGNTLQNLCQDFCSSVSSHLLLSPWFKASLLCYNYRIIQKTSKHAVLLEDFNPNYIEWIFG